LLELDEVRLPRNVNLDFFSDRYRSSHGDHGKQSDDDHQNAAGVSRGEAGCAIVDVELWLAVAAVLGIGIWVLALSALVDSWASALTFLTEVMAHQFGRGRRGWPVFSAVTGLDLVTGGTLVRTRPVQVLQHGSHLTQVQSSFLYSPAAHVIVLALMQSPLLGELHVSQHLWHALQDLHDPHRSGAVPSAQLSPEVSAFSMQL